MEITIDCSKIDGPRQLHRALAEALNFPGWYGNNLDALHDMLTTLPPSTLSFTGWSHMAGFSAGFRIVLEESETENPGLIVNIID